MWSETLGRRPVSSSTGRPWSSKAKAPNRIERLEKGWDDSTAKNALDESRTYNARSDRHCLYTQTPTFKKHFTEMVGEESMVRAHRHRDHGHHHVRSRHCAGVSPTFTTAAAESITAATCHHTPRRFIRHHAPTHQELLLESKPSTAKRDNVETAFGPAVQDMAEGSAVEVEPHSTTDVEQLWSPGKTQNIWSNPEEPEALDASAELPVPMRAPAWGTPGGNNQIAALDSSVQRPRSTGGKR